MKKIGKQSIPNWMNLFMVVKSTFKRFAFIKSTPGLYDGEKIGCLNNERREIIYRGRLINAQSAFFF